MRRTAVRQRIRGTLPRVEGATEARLNSPSRNSERRPLSHARRSAYDSDVPSGRPTVRVKGSTRPGDLTTTFIPRPRLRTPGGAKGLTPFQGRKVSYARRDPRVRAGGAVSPRCRQSRLAPQASQASPAGDAAVAPQSQARRRAVRAGEGVWLHELACAQSARRFPDDRWAALRRGTQRRCAATDDAAR